MNRARFTPEPAVAAGADEKPANGSVPPPEPTLLPGVGLPVLSRRVLVAAAAAGVPPTAAAPVAGEVENKSSPLGDEEFVRALHRQPNMSRRRYTHAHKKKHPCTPHTPASPCAGCRPRRGQRRDGSRGARRRQHPERCARAAHRRQRAWLPGRGCWSRGGGCGRGRSGRGRCRGRRGREKVG